jgi:hypothetical protein
MNAIASVRIYLFVLLLGLSALENSWADEMMTVSADSADVVVNEKGKMRVVEKLKKGEQVKTIAKRGNTWIEVYLKSPQGKITKGFVKATALSGSASAEKKSTSADKILKPFSLTGGYGLARISGGEVQSAVGLESTAIFASEIRLGTRYRFHRLFSVGLDFEMLQYGITFSGGTTIAITGTIDFLSYGALATGSFHFLSGENYDVDVGLGAGMLFGTKATTVINSATTVTSIKSAITFEGSAGGTWYFLANSFGIYGRVHGNYTLPPTGYTNLFTGFGGHGGLAFRF